MDLDFTLPAAFKTEVYVSDDGYVVMTQTNNNGTEEHTVLTPDQAARLAEKMPALASHAAAVSASAFGE